MSQFASTAHHDPTSDVLDVVRSTPLAELVDPETWAAVREVVQLCRGAALSCASRCAGDPDLAECLQRCWDTGDVCTMTSAIMTRRDPDASLVSGALQLCVAACRLSSETCAAHSDEHEHCRIAGSAAQRCEQAVLDLLEEIDRRGAQA